MFVEIKSHAEITVAEEVHYWRTRLFVSRKFPKVIMKVVWAGRMLLLKWNQIMTDC